VIIFVAFSLTGLNREVASASFIFVPLACFYWQPASQQVIDERTFAGCS
jgi:hypothetical protein